MSVIITRGATGMLLLLAATAGTEEILAEAVWAPPAAHRSEPLAESLPVQQRYATWSAGGCAVIGNRDRLDGLLVRHRDEVAPDAQLMLAATAGACGHDVGVLFGPSGWRQIAYLRVGTDSLATDAGQGLVAVGAGAVNTIGGGPTGIRLDGGRSQARGTFGSIEGMLLFTHAAASFDDDARTVRAGLCFRWPGQPLARSPQDDPWSFGLSVDWIRTVLEQAPSDRTGAGAQLTVGWRVLPHLVLLGQLDVVTAAIETDGTDRRGTIAATIGAGTTW